MKLLALLRTGLSSLYQSVKRFPLTIFLTTVTTVLLIIISRADGVTTLETLTRLAMVTALGIPATLSIALAFERTKTARAVKFGSYALAFCLLALYYIFLLPEFGMVTITRYIAITLAFYLAFLFAPYFFRRPGFEMYVIKVINRFLVAGIYSAILFAGLALTLLTIDLLLGIEVSFTFYSNVWLVVAGVFAPCFFLAGLPAIDQDMAEENYPTVLKVLLLYIVMPIILTYTLILYIYFLKTLLTLKWPEGTVSHLVLWYSVFSAGVIFLVYPLERNNKFVQFFTAWFPKLVLPAIIVMFMAIAVRINAYGVTENRYFVVALGLWVLGVMLYYSLTKHFKNIVLPVSLALVALLTVFGPWSAYSVSTYSQNARFETLATEYNMVNGNTLQKPDREISLEDKKAIISILEYFERSHSLSAIRLLPPNFELQNMETVFGFSREDIWAIPGRQKYFHLHTQVKSLEVRDYDHLLKSDNLRQESVAVGPLTVKYSPEDLKLVVVRGDQELYARNLQIFAEQVVERHGAISLELPVQDMTFAEENEILKIRFVFTGITGNDEASQITFENLEFYLLLKFEQ
jgi:hypothetical protein